MVVVVVGAAGYLDRGAQTCARAIGKGNRRVAAARARVVSVCARVCVCGWSGWGTRAAKGGLKAGHKQGAQKFSVQRLGLGCGCGTCPARCPAHVPVFARKVLLVHDVGKGPVGEPARCRLDVGRSEQSRAIAVNTRGAVIKYT